MSKGDPVQAMGHLIECFEVMPSLDGECMAIRFIRPDGKEFVVAIPLNNLHKFREEVDWAFGECAKRAELVRAEPPTATKQ